MSLVSSICNNQQHKTTIYALKNHLLYEYNNNKTHPLSFLHQLNIETDAIKRVVHSNAKIFHNNSYAPNDIDNLSAWYEYYQIDPYLYPPPDLQLYKTIQSSRLQYDILSERKITGSNNSTRQSQNWRKKQKRLRSNKKRKNNNNFHYRNMITVRRISCHDIIDSKMMMKKNYKYKQRKKKTAVVNLIENQSEKYQTFPTELQSSSPFVKLYTPSIQLPASQSSVSQSKTTDGNRRNLTTPLLNSIFQQQEFNKKMSNVTGMTRSKVTSLRDSLVSTQLLSDAYYQMKPNVTDIATATSDSQINFELTTTSSVIPHFSSKNRISKISKTESSIPPSSTNENIQDLVDQLKTCIATLSVILQNETKSNSTKKNMKQSRSVSSSLSSIPKSNHLRFSKNSISNENNLVYEEITVRRCNSSKIQDQTKYQNNTPTLYSDQHEELKRCLLVYCRDRTNNNQDRNINSNERQRNSHCTWNALASNKDLSLSQSSQSIPNNCIDILSTSKSTLILAEEDDEYEPLNELLRMSSL